MTTPQTPSPQRFSCPSCGAPQTYQGNATTIRCAHCGQTIIVPAELRAKRDSSDKTTASLPTINVVLQNNSPYDEAWFEQPKQASWRGALGLSLGVLLLTMLVFFFQESLSERLGAVFNPSVVSNLIPQPARVEWKFGGTGTGEGLFPEANLIAVDGNGTIYVADKTERIQVFDPHGNFENGWQIQGTDMFNAEFTPRALVANRDGSVYVMSVLSVRKYEGKTGELVQTIESPQLGELFTSIALLPDGKLVALTMVFADEYLVWFDAQGRETKRVTKPITSQFAGHSSRLWDKLAVDGLGKVYLLRDEISDGAFVYLLTPEGKYISRFGGKGDENGQFNFARDLAVDAQSRIYVVDQKRIQRFDAQGRFLDAFPASLAGNYITDLALDKNGGMVVIGTENQIYKLVPNEEN
jgi:outer membrane protein assembly factor BamB